MVFSSAPLLTSTESSTKQKSSPRPEGPSNQSTEIAEPPPNYDLYTEIAEPTTNFDLLEFRNIRKSYTRAKESKYANSGTSPTLGI